MPRLPLDQLRQVFSLEALSLSTLFNSQDTEQRTEAASEGVLTNVSVLTFTNNFSSLSLLVVWSTSYPYESPHKPPPLGGGN